MLRPHAMSSSVSRQAISPVKVALIHYWLVGMRGGEKVLEQLCVLFPDATIFTHVCDRAALSPRLRAMRIVETGIARLPMARRLYPSYLPLMPRALEAIDLSGYDLVISSEAGPAKGVIVPPDALHLCYCHSPMRYIWDQYHVYRSQANPMTRAVMPYLAHRLRQWDVTSAARVDSFVANSAHVARRITKYWRRPSGVVHPPVDVARFTPRDAEAEDFYLWIGELAAYKRPDIAIRAFADLGLRLLVVGGPQKARRRLSAVKGPATEFLGFVDDAELADLMSRCRALIYPGEEDFGIIPVEVMAAGRPVIAYGRGGALETVVDRETGLLFSDQTPQGLADAVRTFEAEGLHRLDPAPLRRQAERFAPENFRAGMIDALAAEGVTVTDPGAS